MHDSLIACNESTLAVRLTSVHQLKAADIHVRLDPIRLMHGNGPPDQQQLGTLEVCDAFPRIWIQHLQILVAMARCSDSEYQTQLTDDLASLVLLLWRKVHRVDVSEGLCESLPA